MHCKRKRKTEMGISQVKPSWVLLRNALSCAGFIRLQPFTQLGAIDEDSESAREPKAGRTECCD